MDRLLCMRVFARVVEAESYTQAAEKLGMSRSAVSKRVSQLESELGVRLLNRTTRRVLPTEVGLAYYDRCMRILLEAREADQLVQRLSAAPQGSLTVNAPVSFGTLHLGSAIAEFAAQHHDLDLNIILTDRFTNLVEERYDVAIRVAKQIEPGLIAERISPVRIVLVASPSYLERVGVPVTPTDLANHNCLHYTYLASRDIWHFVGPDGGHRLRVSGGFASNNGDILHQAALGGLGIAHLPTFFVHRELESGELQLVLPDYRLPEYSLFAVYLPNRQPSAIVRLLVEYLRDRFGPEPFWDASQPNTVSVPSTH